jgi:protein disulfide-isomerase-like protein
MNRIVLALGLISTAPAQATDGPSWVFERDVAVLTSDTFDAYIKSQELAMVNFYAPWCAHCKKFAPEWAAAATGARNLKEPVILAKVDGTRHSELVERLDVTSYPRIKCFRGGRELKDYDGPRDAKGILSYLKRELDLIGGLVRISTPAEARDLLKVADHVLIGFFKEPLAASAMFDAFSHLATELPYRNTPIKTAYSASYSKIEPVAVSFGVKAPAVILLHQGLEKPAVLPMPDHEDEFGVGYLKAFLDFHLGRDDSHPTDRL